MKYLLDSIWAFELTITPDIKLEEAKILKMKKVARRAYFSSKCVAVNIGNEISFRFNLGF